MFFYSKLKFVASKDQNIHRKILSRKLVCLLIQSKNMHMSWCSFTVSSNLSHQKNFKTYKQVQNGLWDGGVLRVPLELSVAAVGVLAVFALGVVHGRPDLVADWNLKGNMQWIWGTIIIFSSSYDILHIVLLIFISYAVLVVVLNCTAKPLTPNGHEGV